MAHAPHKNWRDLTQDEYFERQVLAEPDPARKREMREGQVETLRLRAENEKKFGPTPPPPPPPPADPNQHRIQILEAKEKRATDPRVRNNIRGVIRDYQNGALDLNKRRDPYHCAMYWDGVLMRGWASVDDDYFAEEPYRWRVAVPGGKLWIEDGRTQMATALPAQAFVLNPIQGKVDQHQFRVDIRTGDNTAWVRLKYLNDTGSEYAWLYRDDWANLRVPDDWEHWGEDREILTMNGVVDISTVWLFTRIINEETGEWISNRVSVEYAYDLTRNSTDADTPPRPSSPLMLRRLYVAKGGRQHSLVIGETKTSIQDGLRARYA